MLLSQGHCTWCPFCLEYLSLVSAWLILHLLYVHTSQHGMTYATVSNTLTSQLLKGNEVISPLYKMSLSGQLECLPHGILSWQPDWLDTLWDTAENRKKPCSNSRLALSLASVWYTATPYVTWVGKSPLPPAKLEREQGDLWAVSVVCDPSLALGIFFLLFFFWVFSGALTTFQNSIFSWLLLPDQNVISVKVGSLSVLFTITSWCLQPLALYSSCWIYIYWVDVTEWIALPQNLMLKL